MQLRPPQQQCMKCILARRLAGATRLLVVAATGFGKTVIFSQLPRYMRTDKRMMVLVHRDELVNQAVKKIRKSNPELSVGIEKGKQHATDEDVVVASVQTLGNKNGVRLRKFRADDFEWLVIDECHHAVTDQYLRVIEHFNIEGGTTTLVGFTATPNRADGVGLGTVFYEIVFRYGILDGIRDGYLVPPIAYQIKTETSLAGVNVKSETALAKALNTPSRNKQIVKEWVQNAYPRLTIGFTVNVKHAQDLALEFQKAGVPAAAIWGDDPERADKLEKFHNREIVVLLCPVLLTEGFDESQIECVIMARETESQVFFIQAVGRGLRLLEGIDNLVVARQTGLLKPGMKRDCLVMVVCDKKAPQSLVTLPTLFGLPKKMDLTGRDVVETVDAFQKIKEEHPDADFDNLVDIGEVRTYLESIDLLKVQFAEDIKRFSKMQWAKQDDGSYAIHLNDGEVVRVTKDLSGTYSVFGTVKGFSIDEFKMPSLEAAVTYADEEIAAQGVKMITPPTEKQIAALRKFKVSESEIATMSRGQAGMKIVKIIRRYKRA